MDIIMVNLTIICFGLIIGSFINVLAYRIPQNMPVILSRSKCPKCDISIPLYRNIPIFTYTNEYSRITKRSEPKSATKNGNQTT